MRPRSVQGRVVVSGAAMPSSPGVNHEPIAATGEEPRGFRCARTVLRAAHFCGAIASVVLLYISLNQPVRARGAGSSTSMSVALRTLLAVGDDRSRWLVLSAVSLLIALVVGAVSAVVPGVASRFASTSCAVLGWSLSFGVITLSRGNRGSAVWYLFGAVVCHTLSLASRRTAAES